MSLGTSIDGREEREEAQVRLIHHYMKGGRNAGVLIDPHGERVELPSAPSAVVEPEFSDYQQALIWSAAEHANLVGSVQQAARIRQDILACHMAAELCSYLDRSAHWVDWAATQTEVLACARRVNDGPIEANIQRFIGWACARLGRYGDALDHLKEALIVSARFDSPMNDARIHHAMSWAYGASGEYEQALMHAQSSFELYRDSDGRASRQALALNYVGRYHAHLGQYDEALAACVDALDRFTLLKDAYGRAVALDSLGLVHYRLGDYINAIDCYESSSSLWAELRAAHSNATSLTQLGYSQYANGRHEGASSSWEHALAIFDAAGHPDGDILRMSILELRRTEGQD
jgi:tetratricopeptide (TPR) repeat protein